MSIWVEIHCDNASNMVAGCAVQSADYPSALGRSMVVAYDAAVADAHKRRWVKQAGSWYCPHCGKLSDKELAT